MKLKMILSACATLIVAGIAYGYHVASPLQISKNLSLPFELNNTVKNILYYASLAPSSHNAQMWQLQYNPAENNFALSINPAHTLPAADPKNREAYISLGAFLENTRQASTVYGYTAHIDIVDGDIDHTSPSVAAYMRLLPTHTPHSSIKKPTPLSVIENRHSDKRHFENKPIPPALVDTLLQTHPQYLHYYPKGSAQFAYLAQNTVQAMHSPDNAPAKRAELAQWFRFSNQEAQATQDGLPAEQLNITGIKKFFYYLFVNKQTMLGDQFAQQSIEMTQKQIDNCAGFFVITGNDKTPSSWVRAGIHLEKFWLDATASQIAIHPMSILLEEEPFSSQVRTQLGLATQPQMILRAGLVNDYGSNAKIRRNLADFVMLSPGTATQ